MAVSNEVRWAQSEIYKAGKELCSANMRLEGTKYENLSKRAVNALKKLNDALVKDINKE